MIFSSFFRKAKPQRFSFEPRYYDPVKEEIEERTERIKREMQQSNDEQEVGDYRSRISGSFHSRKSSKSVGLQTGLRQMTIIIILVGAMFGYIQFGNDVLYGLLLLVPLYLYFRLKRK
ncbi:MAG: hypothetical protein AAFX87_00515 [Bacteroidota bacterium]